MIGLNHSKSNHFMKKILFGLILLISGSVFSQSNNLDFSMSFSMNPSFTAGLDQVSQQGNIFQVKVSATDLNTISELTVMIYDLKTKTPVVVKRLEQSELLSGTYTQNGVIVFNFPYLDSSMSYKVILEGQNSQQAYLPRIEKNFPTN